MTAIERYAQVFWLLLGCSLTGCNGDTAQLTVATTAPLLEAQLPRYGLNLGGSGTWGAEQLRANVLANPGFEAVIDRTLFILQTANGTRLIDDAAWLVRPDGFWSGGHINVRTGAAAGQSGNVLDSYRQAGNGPTALLLDTAIPNLGTGDVISVQRVDPLQPAPLWWPGQGRVANAPDDPRPGSPGQQSVRLLATPGHPAELLHYLDNIAERAGRLLPVTGTWRFELWARSAEDHGRLHINFNRSGHRPYLDHDISLTSEWQKYTFDIHAENDEAAGVLTLGITAADGEVRIDDAYLGEADPAAGGFRRDVVATLKTLHPGFLRDWQGQLGDTLTNRFASEWQHHPVRYRPGDNEVQFHYGIPDFLALCAAVDAQPWLVAPTTFDDEEWRQFGHDLRVAADRYGFHDVMVEFGNENWNPLFRPAGIPNAVTHAAAADRAFRLLREGSGGDSRLHTVVNAQFVNPDSPKQIGAASRMADRVAVAPYFLYRLNAGISLNDAVANALAEDGDLIQREARTAQAQGKRLAVYEENFHTTLGNADADTRNAVVTGAASGPALARRLLQGTLAGVREQAVYTFSGFDNYLQEESAQKEKGLVRLWGVTRDLASVDRLRPTGLALALLNRVAGNGARTVACAGSPCAGLTAVSYGGTRLALVSARAEASQIQVAIPCSGGTLQLDVLDGSHPERNNENTAQVHIAESRINCTNQLVTFTLPAYSLAALHP